MSVGGQYPDDWDQRRRKVYKRDGYRCQECGAGGGPHGDAVLHCHHKTPISQGGSHEYENLVTVCEFCHEEIHGHEIGERQSVFEGCITVSDYVDAALRAFIKKLAGAVYGGVKSLFFLAMKMLLLLLLWAGFSWVLMDGFGII